MVGKLVVMVKLVWLLNGCAGDWPGRETAGQEQTLDRMEMSEWGEEGGKGKRRRKREVKGGGEVERRSRKGKEEKRVLYVKNRRSLPLPGEKVEGGPQSPEPRAQSPEPLGAQSPEALGAPKGQRRHSLVEGVGELRASLSVRRSSISDSLEKLSRVRGRLQTEHCE